MKSSSALFTREEIVISYPGKNNHFFPGDECTRRFHEIFWKVKKFVNGRRFYRLIQEYIFLLKHLTCILKNSFWLPKAVRSLKITVIQVFKSYNCVSNESSQEGEMGKYLIEKYYAVYKSFDCVKIYLTSHPILYN